jgi:hypothetical protein
MVSLPNISVGQVGCYRDFYRNWVMHSRLFRDYRVRRRGQLVVVAEEFETEWGNSYPPVGQAWRSGLGISRAILRNSPRHSQDELHHRTVEACTDRCEDHQDLVQLPEHDAALKLLCLAINNAPADRWATAMRQFAIWSIHEKLELSLPATSLFAPAKQ